ncbi:hypothetical protein [Sulfuricella sp.]|uniref:hypothetical protein n=1 Tax=Sulfuricella sp. TaxID=2099377 RepID=UPI002B715827|nr:hypothetical protein [Sulfuricella sp.]HUX62941.1 hypothetical protein [Sulfuricella sp.]
MKKTVRIVTTAMAFAAMAMGIPPVEAAMPGDTNAMAKMHRYFAHHSLGFPEHFYQFHPGPHWDLMNSSALRLTPAQIKQEKMLGMGMMQDTERGIMALKKAARQYSEDAKLPNPSIRALARDVQAVGYAQAYLGYEMIPYHIKGYRLLDPAQQVIYHRLARENWIHKMKMMHG